jgi:uncharacterized protein
MKARWRTIAVAAVVLAVVVVGVLLVVRPFGSSVEDPDSAQCLRPPVTSGAGRELGDHREVGVRFTCENVGLAGTVYLPATAGRHPAVVWIHGAGQAPRLGWGGEILPGLVRSGIAVLSYDKRGVGESGGVCCPGDSGHFNLLSADAVGAVSVLRGRPDIDAGQVGLVGASQAGWIAPRAANQAHAAFVALASSPTVPERTANLYERLAGGEKGQLSKEEISRRLKDAGGSGFDPQPDLQRMTIPGLWEFGTADDRTPVEESIAILARLKATGKNITVLVYPNAGHGLLDVPATDPRAAPAMIEWIVNHVHLPTR